MAATVLVRSCIIRLNEPLRCITSYYSLQNVQAKDYGPWPQLAQNQSKSTIGFRGRAFFGVSRPL